MKKQQEPYLKVPARILNLRGLRPGEKLLLAHIYSFGEKGCWQSNKTLAEILMVSVPMIRRWLARLRPYTCVKSPKGYYRTIWAKQVLKNEQGLAQRGTSDLRKSANRRARPRATTNNTTITENNKSTIASPAPLPAGGQASATLEQRRRDLAEKVARFKARFGQTTDWTPMSPEQFERRRTQQLAALGVLRDKK
jgi:hypothetical protein